MNITESSGFGERIKILEPWPECAPEGVTAPFALQKKKKKKNYNLNILVDLAESQIFEGS